MGRFKDEENHEIDPKQMILVASIRPLLFEKIREDGEMCACDTATMQAP
jgi:hypothetical protein